MAKSSTRLVLICGLPASGKSTLARQLAPQIPAIRLDKDGWATQPGADLWDEEFRMWSRASPRRSPTPIGSHLSTRATQKGSGGRAITRTQDAAPQKRLDAPERHLGVRPPSSCGA